MQIFDASALFESPLYTLIAIAVALVIFWLYFYVFDRKFKPQFRSITASYAKRVSYLLLVLIILCSLALNVEIHVWIWGAAEVLILLLYLLIYRKGRLLLKLFWLFVTVTFYVLSQVAATLFIDLLQQQSLLRHDKMLELIASTLFVLVVFGITCLLLARQKQQAAEMSALAIVLFSLTPFLSCIIMIAWFRLDSFFLSVNIDQSLDGDQTILLLLAVMCLTVINLVVLLLYDYMLTKAEESFEQRSLLRESELKRIHYEELKSLYQATRVWRHDYGNHLQAIEVFAHSGSYESLLVYLEELKGSLEEINFRIKTGNELLDAILNTKISYAESLGIAIQLIINADMNTVGLSAVDTSSLLGNLLDNAIEACQKIDRSSRIPTIKLSIARSNNQLSIHIANTNSGRVQFDSKGNPLTTKDDEDHGIGTKQIAALVKKYNGHVQYEVTEDTFETYVVITLESSTSQTSSLQINN